MKGKIMRRGAALLLAALLLTSLAACGGEGDTTSTVTSRQVASHTVDVIAEATAGRMTGVDVHIGQPIEEVEAMYDLGDDAAPSDEGTDEEASGSDTTSAEPLPPLYMDEGESMVQMSTGEIAYYYKKSMADAGISMIVSLTDAYDFEIGITMPDDVRNVIAAEPEESVPTADELFFLPEVPADCLRLRYTAGTRRVDFYFVDEFLSAVTLCEPQWWDVDDAVSSQSSDSSSDAGDTSEEADADTSEAA
ncbi:MAG TPA: hypothetical protein H9668_04960 [Firmicutes bacterium]|nr:hypothetical protein [Bacillota bacterium]